MCSTSAASHCCHAMSLLGSLRESPAIRSYLQFCIYVQISLFKNVHINIAMSSEENDFNDYQNSLVSKDFNDIVRILRLLSANGTRVVCFAEIHLLFRC